MFFERLFGITSSENTEMRHSSISPELLPSSSPKERILLENKIEKATYLLGGSIGDAQYVKIEGNGSGVFKPHRRFSEKDQTQYINNERAAYLIDRFLGFNFVPPTVIREINKERRSLQEFIEDAQIAENVKKGKVSSEELVKLDLFDLIIQNVDRHRGNYLVKENKIWAIDHGCTFDENMRSHIPSYLDGKQIPYSTVESLRKFIGWKEGVGLLRDLLSELLPNADKYIARIFAIAEAVDTDNIITKERFEVALQKHQELSYY
ncbi:MAG: hypothetical protein AAB795_00880 [Patescibacteria group bacterium]